MMADPFAGAEGEVDRQKAAALNILAQHGRTGLEEATASTRLTDAVAKDTNEGFRRDADAVANTLDRSIGVMGTPLAARKELTAIAQPSFDAYRADAAGNADLLRAEQGAVRSVNANYFDQARQGVPALRSANQATREAYAAAAAERRAQQRAAMQAAEQQRQLALAQLAQTQYEQQQSQFFLGLLAQRQKELASAGAGATLNATQKLLASRFADGSFGL